jgi:ribonuclease BN (tRNA processing enzyme)
VDRADEYFHGDHGAGLGASHQTGWTGVVAALIQVFGQWSAQEFLETAVGAQARQTS